MSTAFPQDAKVRFTQERLALLTARDRQGLAGRVGVIQTDGRVIRKPTVYFPADGAKPELRLFGVDPRQLELVEGPPSTETPSDPHDGARASESPAPDGGGNLSQSDLDNFFD
jgi:hypothetical protein